MINVGDMGRRELIHVMTDRAQWLDLRGAAPREHRF